MTDRLPAISTPTFDPTKAVVATGSDLPPAVIEQDEDTVMGVQLTIQWDRVVGGQRQQIIFGAMMLKLRDRVDSARGANSAKRGPGTKGTGLKAWLEKYAPKVSEGTAYRLMEIAEGVHEICKLGKKVDLEELLANEVEEVPEKLRKKREEIEQLIEGKSQRQLLLQFGGATGKARGGDTTNKATKPLTPEEEEAELTKTIRSDALAAFAGIQEIGPRYRLLTDAEVETAAETLEKSAKELREWLSTPKAKRPVVDKVKALLGEAH